MERKNVTDLRDRDRIQEVYLCSRKGLNQDRNGNPYLHLVLSDRTGEVEALLWGAAARCAENFSAGELVEVQGTVALYQGRQQLHLTAVHPVAPDSVAAENFLPRATGDVERQWAELAALLGTIKEPHLQQLLRSLLEDAELVALIKASPAARSIHHAYLGGLLEHTLSVMRLCDLHCAHYAASAPGLLDRDLCLTGAFLHDLGKTREISRDPGFRYTDEGRLVGHIVLGLELLEGRLRTLEGFPAALALHLKHILASHHGRLEHGAVKRPMTAEALLVHRADELDAQVECLQQTFRRHPAGGWTAHHPTFDRPLFQGWPGGGTNGGEEEPRGW